MLAARHMDVHVCPMVTGVVPHVGGPVGPVCSSNVLTNSMMQARQTDPCICTGPLDTIAIGCFTVHVNHLPAARMGDLTIHGGTIMMGSPNVLIGSGGGGGAPASSMAAASAALSGAAAMGQPGAQAKALIGAHQKGAYFCRRCMEA